MPALRMPPRLPSDASSAPQEELGPGTTQRTMGWALAAAAGLCLAACEKETASTHGEKPAMTTGTDAKNCCFGKNDCKGKGGCAVAGKNGCAGKNECKGQGGCNMHCPK